MSSQGQYLPPLTVNPAEFGLGAVSVRKERPRYWLHLLLLLLTLFTTTMVGAELALRFTRNLPTSVEADWLDMPRFLAHPAQLAYGLVFSLPLIIILLAHEFGHYYYCLRHRVDASLPYFLPAPTLIGTLGAFIRIRSHIYSKRVLFDIGIAGPLAGYAVLVPFLMLGMALSKVIPGIMRQGDVLFGVPLLVRLFEALFFPHVPAADIYLHPIARAAWVGIFATALNLLPIGQLDGGHILYAVLGERSKYLSRFFIFALVPLGYFYWPWYAWAAVLFLFGRKHPFIYDPEPLDARRRWLAALALVLFVLSFMPVPVTVNGF